MADTTGRGAHALDGGDRRRRGGWLPWLLGLLLLAAIVVALIALLGGDDDDGGRAATGSGGNGAATGGAGGAGGAGSAAGTLTAGGTALIGSGAEDIADHVGERATGSGLRVQSVVESGFFVGTSADDRRYVEYGSDVGADEPGQRYAAKVGDVVDLQGPVRPAPDDPGRTLKLGADDAALVTNQGAYVNATTVRAAG